MKKKYAGGDNRFKIDTRGPVYTSSVGNGPLNVGACPDINIYGHGINTTQFFLYNDQQMHNYLTNYHIPPTCFDTIV